MRRVCAWCAHELAPVSGDLPDVISHAICPACEDNLHFQQGAPLNDYLAALPMPVAVVNIGGRVEQLNPAACAMLGVTSAACAGKLGGEVFECRFARLPGGCGGTVHCSGCAIRRTVMATFATHVPQSRVPATLRAGTLDAPCEVQFYISTRFTGGVVLLLIEPASLVVSPEADTPLLSS